MKNDWTHPFNVYTGRPDADGRIYTYSMQMWFVLLVGTLASLNALFWSGYGLYAFAEKVI